MLPSEEEDWGLTHPGRAACEPSVKAGSHRGVLPSVEGARDVARQHGDQDSRAVGDLGGTTGQYKYLLLNGAVNEQETSKNLGRIAPASKIGELERENENAAVSKGQQDNLQASRSQATVTADRRVI